MPYFSDRECGETPPTLTELTPVAWRGIAALIQGRLNDHSFGSQFPEMCRDGAGPCGTDYGLFWDTIRAEIPALAEREQVLAEEVPPPLLEVMDMIEFCWRKVGKVEQGGYHSYWQHHHLSFDIEAGKTEFKDAVNLILRRNGLAFSLTEQGSVERLLPAEIGDALHHVRFQTGDRELDGMLESARRKFLDADERVRREALEKLWDAWERIKTVGATDKKTGTVALLDRTAGSATSKFRSMLEDEARDMTNIGNGFQIRHSETTQERLSSSEHVDYLFHRMFSLIHLILVAAPPRGER